MEEIKLVIAKNAFPKAQRIIFSLLAVSFLFLGISNLLDNKNVLYPIAVIQVVLGSIYLIGILIVFSKYNKEIFIGLHDEKIVLRDKWYRDVISLDRTDIISLEVSKLKVVIRTKERDYKINFEPLDYSRRISELPLFVESLNEYKALYKL